MAQSAVNSGTLNLMPMVLSPVRHIRHRAMGPAFPKQPEPPFLLGWYSCFISIQQLQLDLVPHQIQGVR